MTIIAKLDHLLTLSNPLKAPPWRNARDLTPVMIEQALAEDDLWPEPVDPDAPLPVHVARIAWFVRMGWDDPVQIDVGCPSFPGWREIWPITDGNHRVAAAAFRRDTTILLEWGGEVERAKRIFGAELIEAELITRHDVGF